MPMFPDPGRSSAERVSAGGSPRSRRRHRMVVSGLGADAVVVRVRGHLDGDLGADLVDLVDVGFEAAPMVKLDLRGVVDYTDDGLAALAACTSLGARISPRPAGLS